MKQLSMLNFNSLRQHAPELFAVAIPVGIALAIHAVWIGISGRPPLEPKGSGLSAGNDSTVVDNTAQLVRVTRRAAQQRNLASVGLDLSGTLPSPLDAVEPVDLPDQPDQPDQPTADCPSPAAAGGTVVAAPKAPTVQPKQPTVAARTREDPPLQSADELAPAEATGIDATSIKAFWQQAMGVPIWPKELGPKQESVVLRELSLADFQGRSAKELHNKAVAMEFARYQLKVLGDRVLILKTPLNP